MPSNLELSFFCNQDIEKTLNHETSHTLDHDPHPKMKMKSSIIEEKQGWAVNSHRKELLYAIVLEAVATAGIFVYYAKINEVFYLLGACSLGGSTAALAQTLTQFHHKNYSKSKILKFIVWGCLNGTFSSLWIDFLVAQYSNIVIRVVIDQVVGSPLFQLMFLVLSCIWDNKDIVNKTNLKNYLQCLKVSYFFWPFFSSFSFWILPFGRVFFANCIASLIWNLILSSISSDIRT